MQYRNRPADLLRACCLLSLLWCPVLAVASPVVLTWTNATQNTDGTSYDNPDITRIYYGECELGEVPASPLIQIAPHAEETATLDLGPAEWCFCATHVNIDGEESECSGTVSYTIAPPLPPGDLTVGPDTTAFAISQSNDRLVLFPVGNVPVGTDCDETMSVNGKYRVDRADVTFAGTVDPPVVLAECGN